ncbi:MAG: uroporphyrinogen-III C-methyltransferase [Gammaproteobacteria bacterium]|nr:uroporphyrinogen-III C-methyltransferase [Gammaproteobacteria bacterium]
MTETPSRPASGRPPKSRRRRRRPTAATPAPANSGGGRRALAIALVALAASAYLVYQSEIKPYIDGTADDGGQQQRLDAMEQRLAAQADVGARVGRLETRLDGSEAAFDARLRQWRGELSERQAAAADREQAMLSEVRGLADSVASLRADAAGKRDADTWRLAEVEHLLVIANQRLQLAGDVQLARRALSLADNRLRDIPDPALAPVRGLIADEIVALDQAATVDVAGTLHALAALSRAAGQLPLAGDALVGIGAGAVPPPRPAAPQAAQSPPQQADGWLAAGRNLLADLGAMVQVETREAGPPRPILSAEMRAMIYARTRLILESSQLAFMHGEGGVYAERTAAAAAWVTDNFDAESAAVRAWLAQLSRWAAVTPEVELPDISRSLRALREAGGG